MTTSEQKLPPGYTINSLGQVVQLGQVITSSDIRARIETSRVLGKIVSGKQKEQRSVIEAVTSLRNSPK